MFLKKLRSVDCDEREIAIMRDEEDRGRIFVGIAVAFDGEIAAVADDVGIGHDAVAIDHESRADAATDRAGVPRRFVIGFDRRRSDANKTLFWILPLARWLRRRDRHGDNWPEALSLGSSCCSSAADAERAAAERVCCACERVSSPASDNRTASNNSAASHAKSEKMRRSDKKSNSIRDG